MNRDDRDGFNLTLYFLSCLFLVLFLYGFFPIGSTPEFEVNETPYSGSENGRVDRIILLVIDALRVDFVLSPSSGYMPFTESTIKRNESCFLVTQATAPTVTMPRIKAMTSGRVPNYVDVVLNLGSSEFLQDTFVRQAAQKKLFQVFHGDDTWIKLFPNYFNRSSGVHSFFAADFWEVDKNVTRELKKELLRTDWNVLILHYLGLDHIGHIEGPQSPHIRSKLKEMDEVIREIHLIMKNSNLSSIFFLTGDHGMKDSGGHGGTTAAERYVPLVSIGKPCHFIDGWPSSDDIPQIDLASTISLSLGLPIPSNNMGKPIPQLLPHVNLVDLLKKLKKTRHELLHRYVKSKRDSSVIEETDRLLDAYLENDKFVNVSDVTRRLYFELCDLSQEITKSREEFHLSYMVLGCAGLWIVLLFFIYANGLPKPSSLLQVLLVGGTISHTFSLASSSFIEEEHQTWYFLWSTFLVFCLRERWRRKVAVQSYILDRKSCSLVLMCIIHRLARKLNQTGDKWAYLPDWDDYIRTRTTLMAFIFVFSILWLYYLLLSEVRPTFPRLCLAAALMSITCYRFAINSFPILLSTFKDTYISSGVLEVRLFFIFWILVTITSKSSVANWTLLCALTARPINIVLIPTFIFMARQVNTNLAINSNQFWKTLAHLWMGSLFYFYQGNSNSLASIDVAAAFIGVESYQPFYAGILTAVSAFGFHGLAFLLSPRSFSAVTLTRLLTITFYTTLMYFQRTHLFVWSVFSPKLLIDSALHVLTALVLTISWYYK